VYLFSYWTGGEKYRSNVISKAKEIRKKTYLDFGRIRIPLPNSEIGSNDGSIKNKTDDFHEITYRKNRITDERVLSIRLGLLEYNEDRSR